MNAWGTTTPGLPQAWQTDPQLKVIVGPVIVALVFPTDLHFLWPEDGGNLKHFRHKFRLRQDSGIHGVCAADNASQGLF